MEEGVGELRRVDAGGYGWRMRGGGRGKVVAEVGKSRRMGF